jgi:putative SOS response-associated peptidase YedK
MCNLYSITTNQAAIIALFRVINHNVGNLPPMPGVFPDYPAPVVRNTDNGTEMVTMRWDMAASGGPVPAVIKVIYLAGTSVEHRHRLFRRET